MFGTDRYLQGKVIEDPDKEKKDLERLLFGFVGALVSEQSHKESSNVTEILQTQVQEEIPSAKEGQG